MPGRTLAPENTQGTDRLEPRTKLVISLLLVSSFVVILNETIMGVALPRLMKDLDITASAGQWLTTAFMLTMAVVIPITGYLLKRFNTRPVFMAAMTLFSAGTLLAALSPGFGTLVLARVIQASGTAIMMPLLMTTVMTLVPLAKRGSTMGMISIVISVAPALGPTISGVILSALDWRWMFWLVLPISIGSLLLGAAGIKNVTTPTRLPIDVLSVILSALAFGGLIYGLSSLGQAAEGGASVPSWIPLTVGSAALVVFVLRQLRLQRTDAALLDLRTFTSSGFTIPIVLMAVAMVAMFGTLILLPIYLQTVLGLKPVEIGLMLLPGGLVMGLLGPVVGRIYDRRGPTVLVVPGAAIVSLVFWSMTLFTTTTHFGFVLAAHVGLSVGLALMFTPLFTSALGAVKPELYSHGSAIVGTVQQVAGAVGTALFITVMAAVSASASAAGDAPVAALAEGIHAAFVCGAVISLLALAGTFLVRKPAEQPMPAAVAG
ncbi:MULTISPECIES: MDR family MFS transporter [unclassified Diaminobutyricimonas]|uniref:MDR family MFS transporter n=1 Tax=unclassified Diaminobutyricimonas TaxID=2643261 RepID=UPI0012F50870|nr:MULTISPECIES: MDR family MFS transporter [unclassified Diaminobutyricimonas]